VRALVYRKNYTPGAKYLQALEKPSLNTSELCALWGRVFLFFFLFFQKKKFLFFPGEVLLCAKRQKKIHG
jgi:hypothetical protein